MAAPAQSPAAPPLPFPQRMRIRVGMSVASANAAQQLGGALSFRSGGPGQGAVFTLELPLAAPQPRKQDEPSVADV